MFRVVTLLPLIQIIYVKAKTGPLNQVTFMVLISIFCPANLQTKYYRTLITNQPNDIIIADTTLFVTLRHFTQTEKVPVMC